MYLTFAEYTGYGGTLDETAFNQYEFKARKQIDSLTAMRVASLATISEAVKRCMYELVKQEQIYDDNIQTLITVTNDSTASVGKLIASFTTDGYQETYANGGNADPGTYVMSIRKALDDAEKQIIRDYLAYERDDSGTLLLYRGVW